jgi:ribonuclease Z
VLNVRERLFLIDCGEGTQMQLARFKVRAHRISHIFISHLHGDHYLGLMGLLSTMHLQGRTAELHLYGQQDLMDILDLQLRLSNTTLRFNLIFHAVRHYLGGIVFEDEHLLVKSIVMNHRIPCTGFLFREKPRPRKLLINKIRQYGIPISFYNRIKEGDDFVSDDGAVHPNAELSLAPPEPKSYAFCSDTLYDDAIAGEVHGVDLLYHEATFSHDLLDRARATYHATSRQAAELAAKARVKKLLIGHFSARYKDLAPLLKEAREVFPQTELAIEGNRFDV